MKRANNLYKKICDIDVIMNMYDKVIRVNTKNKKKIQNFENFYSCNIVKIKEILMRKDYVPGKYNLFLIHEPKMRIIMSQQIEDKVINHLIAKYFLIDVFDKNLSSRNCATRIGKGTHYALKIFKQDYNYFLNKYDKFYILKLDISKYFYNLDHDIIKNMIENKIKDKKALKIIFDIIDSNSEDYVNDRINELKEEEINRIKRLNISEKEKRRKINEVKEIPLYNNKGLSIGNMVSQIVATMYLNELDQYIKSKHFDYCRYMDDGVIFCGNKELLKYLLLNIDLIINSLKLKLNRKTKIYNSKEEIEFLGFRFFIKNNKTIMKLTNKTKKKLKNNLNINNIPSYKGHLKYGTCNALLYCELLKKI